MNDVKFLKYIMKKENKLEDDYDMKELFNIAKEMELHLLNKK
ncbi:hypothetical protein B0P06_005202 [Clostridium saccharoperbutylacetonicum]|nr:hypothetical protein [Clostridium saccharoperbutylacetonicum]NRT62725.1 hypothetical protein [Clostridium saccharoperbutylacetonicum]NSB26076.1 hypothetical protein [Clostridium saccharoperbutylacetonicum]NSB45431.1 hypothetical protein [Clostridium saccharoperbutylacetonicum]